MTKEMKLFICEDCGEKFTAMKDEDSLSPTTSLPRCPHCGGRHTRPSTFLGMNRWLYRKIWDDYEQ